jgi:hypothetical protein
MIKEFEVNDILNAVNDISKINKKKNKNFISEKEVAIDSGDLNPDNQAKSEESEILVLNQMIE